MKSKHSPIKLANGMIRDGQLIVPLGGGPMKSLSVGKLPAMPARAAVDTGLPKNGSPKVYHAPAIAGARIANDMDIDPAVRLPSSIVAKRG